LDKKIVIITGISGQDGQYLTKILVERNYFVVGITTSPKIEFYEKFSPNSLKVLQVNEYSKEEIKSIIEIYPPSCIVNFTAQSSVRKSWDDQDLTWKSNHSIVLNFLDVIEEFQNRTKSQVHFVQAGSSEMFGNPLELPLNENSSMVPVSPYAKSKYEAYKSCQKARKSSNIKVANLILFNHESFLRKPEFLCSQIISQAKSVKRGDIEFIDLMYGSVQRDWGHAKDFMDAVYLIIQEQIDDDLIISTGKAHSVKEFAECALRKVGVVELEKHIRVQFEFPPSNIPPTIYGDNSKIKSLIPWKPRYSFEEMISEIMDH
jgi:GDPmannose 4,6-dehydratase